MTAYYNEIDEKAAAWLRELIRRNLIAPGDVDTRSIEDVSPDDLLPYTQCHFFAGIGVWSYALRLAGWPDDRPVWTGSCPCQPFSAAGKGGGFADERHLWPAQFHLVRERRPVVWLGEQVASKDGLAWLDLVQADLEGEGYAVGAVDTCSAGFGAPHIRQRLRIAAQRVADADRERHARQHALLREETRERFTGHLFEAAGSGAVERVADTHGRHASAERQQRGGEQRQQSQDSGAGQLALCCDPERYDRGQCDTACDFWLEHASGDGRIERRAEPSGRGLAGGCGLGGLEHPELPAQPRQRLVGGAAVHEQDAAGLAGAGVADGLDGDARNAGLLRQQTAHPGAERPGSVNGFWRAADWLFCRDGKWRPVEPGTFPLAHGASARVGRLRGYGNAVDAEATRYFIEAAVEAFDLRLMSDPTTNTGIFA